MRLFSTFIIRGLIRQPLRSVTTIAGIALGIAVVIAIQLANAGSLAGFDTALGTVSGRASLEIVGAAGGIDERVLVPLEWLRAYGDVAPIVEGDVAVRRPDGASETLRLLGIDILRDRAFREYHLLEWAGGSREPSVQDMLTMLLDPRSAILAAKFAEPLGLTLGSTVTLHLSDRTLPVVIRGLLKDDGPARVLDGHFMLMDIAAAQLALDRLGVIDRLEIRLSDTQTIDRAEAAIAARLPAGLSVERPSRRGRQVEHMLAAFHANLTALSCVALVVGLFFVYNTVSVSVLSRRSEIGTLRAVGATRRTIRALFLGEAAILAVLGCSAGVLIGRVLANAAVALTSTTVSELYVAAAAAPPALEWTSVLLAFAIGVPLSIAAAWVPAAEAARVPPIVAARGADRIATGGAGWLARRAVAAIALLIAGAWFTTRPAVHGLPLFGYAAAAAIVFGASLLVPAVLVFVTRLLSTVRRRLRIEDRLALANMSASVRRLSISTAALAVSLSMLTAIAIMIGSFRETVVAWIGQTLQADLFVSPGSLRRPSQNDALSPDVVQAVRDSPDVAAVDPFRLLDVTYGDTRIRIAARDFNVVLAHGTVVFKTPADPRPALSRADSDDVVIVSEAFALKQRLRPGDRVNVPTPAGDVPFAIAAVYFDYSSDRGVLLMDTRTFARHFGDRPANGISTYLKPGVNDEAARGRLLGRIGSAHEVFVATNRALRAEVLRIFDSTFAVTYALEVIAIIVAILGVSGTLLTLILEREREYAILRLIGATRAQLRRVVIGEALLVGTVSQGVGLVTGAALSLVLIYVINVQSFGWTIQRHAPVAFLVQSSIAVIVATALAGVYPAARAARLAVREPE